VELSKQWTAPNKTRMIARQTAASKDGLFSALRPCLRKTLSIFFPAFDVGGEFCCGKPGAKLDRIRSVNLSFWCGNGFHRHL